MVQKQEQITGAKSTTAKVGMVSPAAGAELEQGFRILFLIWLFITVGAILPTV